MITRGGSPAVRSRRAGAKGSKVIPQFHSFGHQSWAKETWPLLTKYPAFDLDSGCLPPEQGDLLPGVGSPEPARVPGRLRALSTRSSTPSSTDAVHVGMDEVFLIGNDAAPSTKDKDPAEVFAKAVNDMYAHVVRARGRGMLMWGDRLIDAERYDYGEWEASKNNTWPAIYMIPKDSSSPTGTTSRATPTPPVALPRQGLPCAAHELQGRRGQPELIE